MRIFKGVISLHSTLILLISKPFEVALPKVQHIYNLWKNEFSPNLEGVAQKMSLLYPLEGFDVFGRKSKSKAPIAFKFGAKQLRLSNDFSFKSNLACCDWLCKYQNQG